MTVNIGITQERARYASEACHSKGGQIETNLLVEGEREPQYKQLARVLLAKMHSGEYAVGSLLPTELDLCEMFKTSRHTVREALRQLQQQGVVSRRARVGTRVLAQESTVSYQQSLDSIEDLIQFGETNIRVVKQLNKDYVMDMPTAAELDCAPGSRWLQVRTVRLDEKHDLRPVCWTENYVDPLYSSIGPIIKASPKTLISSIIEKHFGQRVLKITQAVSASVVPRDIARALDVAAGAPALLVIRHYFDELNKIFIITRTLHPDVNYKIKMVLVQTGKLSI